MIRLIGFLGLAAVAVIAGGMFLGEDEVRYHPAAATPREPVAVGGLVYRSMDARTLDPRNRVDREILSGIPAARRPLPSGEQWFGVFLTVTNPGSTAVRPARRFSLVDIDGRRFTPQSIPRDHGYAYRPALVRPGRQYPPSDSVPARNLTAQGALLLFRIPRASYKAGALELLIPDPAAGRPAPMAVS